MTQISVDAAPPAVKKFIRSLPIHTNGVEVMLGGNVVCKIIPPGQLSDAEKSAQLADVRQLLGESRRNSQRVPAPEIERRIRGALNTVRGER